MRISSPSMRAPVYKGHFILWASALTAPTTVHAIRVAAELTYTRNLQIGSALASGYAKQAHLPPLMDMAFVASIAEVAAVGGATYANVETHACSFANLSLAMLQ